MGEGGDVPLDPPPPYSPPRTSAAGAPTGVQPVIVYVERSNAAARPQFGCWKTAFLTVLIFQTIGVTGLTLMFSSALSHPDLSEEMATVMVTIICLSMTHVLVGWVGATKHKPSFLYAYLAFSMMFIFVSRILYLERQGRVSGPNLMFNLLSIVVTLGFIRRIKEHQQLVRQTQLLGHPELVAM